MTLLIMIYYLIIRVFSPTQADVNLEKNPINHQ